MHVRHLLKVRNKKLVKFHVVKSRARGGGGGREEDSTGSCGRQEIGQTTLESRTKRKQ